MTLENVTSKASQEAANQVLVTDALGFLTKEMEMGTQTENLCMRCRTDCTPLANLSSDGTDKSFVCVGANHPASRTVAQDRFTLCWKNNAVDERGHWDKRDLIDTMSVIAQALSTDENIAVNNKFTEAEMREVNFLI